MKTKILSFILLTIILISSAFADKAKAAYIIPEKHNNSIVQSEDIELIKRFERAFNQITTEAKKSVVFINISKMVKSPEYFYLDPFEELFGFRGQFQGRHHSQRPRPEHEVKGLGSGFIIDVDKGYILTNNHVVGDADKITVKTSEGNEYIAEVIGKDEKTDIAVIQVKNLPTTLKQIHLAKSEDVHVGDWALAIGAPMGLQETVTRGIISAKGRGSLEITGYGDFLQTDAAINPGNSGGPLVNTNGDAIGMNTAILSRSGGSQGTGFAIPANILRDVAQKLINEGEVKRAYLGVGIQNFDKSMASAFGVDGNAKGVLIASIESDGPAEKAGLKSGDIITSINGVNVENAEKLSYQVSMSPIGEKIPVTFIRDGKASSVQVILKYRDGEDGGRLYGDAKNKGWGLQLDEELVVQEVLPNSPAAISGLRPGDKVVEVNRKRVKNIKEFKKYDTKKEMILLKIKRSEFFEIYVMLQK